MKNSEDLTIMWLDVEQVYQNKDDYLDAKTCLRECHSYIEMYDDTSKCIDSIKKNDEIFLVVSGSICETFIPQVCENKNIKLIYILSVSSSLSCPEKLKNITKINGIYFNKNELFDKLKRDVISYSKSFIATSIVNEKSIRSLDKEYSMFMWMQLLIDVLIQMPQTNERRRKMLDDCEKYYAGNKKYLDEITEFKDEYDPYFAVWWYTRDTFVYKQLNKAFRTQDIDAIFKYQFFIKDLYTQLKELHLEFLPSLDESLVLFRGQTLGCDEFENIKNNVGGLICMNSFLSTTKNRELALWYAGDGSNRPLLESTLFVITIDKDVASKCKPFADIKHMSQFGKAEEEVLLSMGTVFKIDCVKQLSEKDLVWEIKLTLSKSVVNNEIDMLFQYFKTNVTTDISNIGTLGLLLGQMGEYKKAQEYYRLMIDELPNDDSVIPLIYNNIGILYSDMGCPKRALNSYKKSFDGLRTHNIPENDMLFANLYFNMGTLYYDMDDGNKALKYFNKSLEICGNNTTLPGLLLTASLDTSLAEIFEDDGEFEKALVKLQEALKIQLEVLPLNHFRIAATYNNIGGIYLSTQNYRKALSHFKTALDIGLKSLPPSHEHIQTYTEHVRLVEEKLSLETSTENKAT